MRYANKAAHLLDGGRRVVSAAILYHAEAEWMAGVGRAMLDEVPARALSDANLDFSIVCADALLDPATALRDGRLAVGDETIPALRRLSPAGVSCAAGAGPVLLPVARRGAEGPDDAALVSPLICFEDTVPATARASARGADVLLSISNDAWFEGTCESAQHHAEAAFRAIENGVPLVRVSNHGATGVVLPSGEATPDATGGFLVHAVPLLPRGRAPTPYARFRDWLFGFPCAALALLAAFLPARRRSDSGIPH